MENSLLTEVTSEQKGEIEINSVNIYQVCTRYGSKCFECINSFNSYGKRCHSGEDDETRQTRQSK